MAIMQNDGRLWLAGEMEIPVNEGPAVALREASRIAEACGYLASYHYGKSAIQISGGDIAGFVVLDWFSTDNPRLKKIEQWSCSAEYLD